MGARPQPERGEAAKGLAALVEARHQLDGRLSEIDQQQRQATEDVQRLSAELADLERRAAGGEQVSAQARTKAEQALTKARVRHGEPWAERRAGVHAAIRDAERDVRVYVVEHLDELLADLHGEGEDAAEDVNRACRDLEEAYLRRMAVEQRVFALVSRAGGRTNPGDVRRTQAEAVVREARALLQQGGEVAPILIVDPRGEQAPPVIAAQDVA